MTVIPDRDNAWGRNGDRRPCGPAARSGAEDCCPGPGPAGWQRRRWREQMKVSGVGMVVSMVGIVGGVAFLIQFILIWLGVWLVADGPMRVPFIRWRFQGGRLV